MCEAPDPWSAEPTYTVDPAFEPAVDVPVGPGFTPGPADPAGATDAFGHYAEPDACELPEEPLAPAVDRVARMSGEDQAQELRDMDESEFIEILDELPVADQASMESLIAACDDPQRKLELWRTYHSTMNQRDLEGLAETDDEEARKRREKIIADTDNELADEIAALEAKGTPPTLEEVNKLIARKELEHKLEMQHNINLTNSGATRADGTRVVWTEEELRVLEGTLDQVPQHIRGDAKVLSQIHRGERDAANNNAINDPNGGIVTLFDNGARTTQDSKREAADPGLPEHTTWMEHVMLHEIGHSAHNQDLGKHLDPYKEATAHIPGAEHAEYFAQDFKNAMLNPAKHYQESIVKPQQELAAAEQALKANPNDPAAQAAAEAARNKAAGWKKMYDHMRDEVFDADGTENSYIAQLESFGADEEEIKEFKARAAGLSTPDQIHRLAEEYRLDVP